MKWGRELGLALLVAVAGAAFYSSLRRDQQGIQFQEEALFPGFDAARVRTIIAESTTRDWHVRFEHDSKGGWRLVDPTAIPANFWRVEHLLKVALAARGRPVPGSEQDAQQLGLQPPRMVLEIEELLDGQSHHERVEIGGLDADGRSVNVRVRGRALRAGRELDTALDRQIDEFKTDLALEFQIAELVALRRSGSLQQEDAHEAQSVALELRRTDEGWRSVAPADLLLDPQLLGAWLQGLASIRPLTGSDGTSVSLEQYGLDPPELRLELEFRDGAKQALRLGRPGHAGAAWCALREGLPLVWGLDERQPYLVGWPLENLLDVRLLRAQRPELTSLLLHGPQGDLKFTLEGKQWQLAQRRASEKAFDRALLADPAQVGQLLDELEQAELVDFHVGGATPETPEAPAVWIGVGGLTQGGWFGEPAQSKAGADCVRFQRRGEDAWSLAPKTLLEAIGRPIESFWSQKLADILEYEQVALAIQGRGKDLRYLRDKGGKWVRAGTDVEAKELHPVLDALCFLRAKQYLRPLVEPPWDDTLTVKFTGLNGKEKRIEVGRSREAAAGSGLEFELLYDKLRAVAQDQDLHARLVKILEAP